MRILNRMSGEDVTKRAHLMIKRAESASSRYMSLANSQSLENPNALKAQAFYREMATNASREALTYLIQQCSYRFSSLQEAAALIDISGGMKNVNVGIRVKGEALI